MNNDLTVQTSMLTPTNAINANSGVFGDDLTTRQLYLVLNSELGRTGMTRWDKMPVEKLAVINQCLYYELETGIQRGGFCYFVQDGRSFIGRVVSTELRSTGFIAIVYVGSLRAYLVPADELRMVSMPANGKIVIRYGCHIVKMSQHGNTLDFKRYNTLRMKDSVLERWHQLFQREGVTVSVPGNFNQSLDVIIL